MLRTIRTVAAASLFALTMTGCVTTGGGGTPVVDDTFISQVQRLASEACGYLPAARSIATLLALGGYASAFDIASAICAAAVPPQSTRKASGQFPVVRGVPIRGKFIR